MIPFRSDFPVLNRYDIAYLDNAATTQRPTCVIDAISKFYQEVNANPLRGLYELSTRATEAYQNAREKVASFLHAQSSDEIIFTRNTSESINLVAYSYGLKFLKPGDRIVTTVSEHHSNMLPWQFVASKTGCELVYMEPSAEGLYSDEELGKITVNTKLVAIAQISNVFGRVNPIKAIAQRAHEIGAVILVDAAQSAPHMAIDVCQLDVDFLAFSGHKLMGPMGIGALYGKKSLLESMDPFLRGGEMIDSVSLDGAKWAPVPHKFEAGTVNAPGAVGLAAAIDYLEKVGFDYIHEQESRLTKRAFELMEAIPHVHIIGSKNPEEHTGIITFILDQVHPHDISSLLDSDGVNVRAGHHCAEPLMKHLGVSSTTRASLYFYNSLEDVERFTKSLSEIRKVMGYAE